MKLIQALSKLLKVITNGTEEFFDGVKQLAEEIPEAIPTSRSEAKEMLAVLEHSVEAAITVLGINDLFDQH